ncbi:MAG TPA: zinc ribbon domain-containing protein [Longimicrobium sp.]|jgi:putative FmdB family regulatory protein|nr:zinc ribbon domain-containing protein [Longimicrobium sp.]
MPTYEYRCPACGTDFEKFQKMSDLPAAECPSCGAAAERRISGGSGLVFKGSGFYITDYRGEGYKKAAEADKGGSPAAPAPASPSGDAKPAAESKPAPKPESKPSPKSE